MHFEETKYSCCCFCFSMPLPTIKDDAESSLHMTCNFTELALTESGLSDVQLLKTQHCSCYAACHICIMQDQFKLIFDRLPLATPFQRSKMMRCRLCTRPVTYQSWLSLRAVFIANQLLKTRHCSCIIAKPTSNSTRHL